MTFPANRADRPSLPLARMLTSVLPFMAVLTPVAVIAGVATNTVTITAGEGEVDPTADNNTAIDTDTVLAALFADPDAADGIIGANGAAAVINVLDGDTINGVQVTPNDVDIEVLTPAAPMNLGDLVPVLDTSTGLVDVLGGTPAGIYTISYQICEKANPANCAQANVTITVEPPEIVAGEDTPPSVNGAEGSTGEINVFENDTLNGDPVSPDEITATVTGPAVPVNSGDPVPSLDPDTGLVSVLAGTPAGTYTIAYEICETLNPTNCATSAVTIEVEPSEIIASDDTISDIPAGQGADDVINVFDNDTLNGEPLDPNDVTMIVTLPASDPGVDLDPSTGSVSVAADVPPGLYTIEFEICEVLNPSNCVTSSVTVEVVAAVSAVQGAVYLDNNGNQQLDADDQPRGGWIVELLRNRELIANTATDADGSYLFENLLSGDGYEIRFRNPQNNVLYGKLDDLELASNIVTIDQNLPIDPSGVVYNSITRAAVAGAIVTFNGPNRMALPDECFVDASQQNQITDTSGEYRFDIIPGAAAQCPTAETEYTIAITPPAGFGFVSTVLLPQEGALNPTGRTGPVRIASTAGAPSEPDPTYYLSFLLEENDPDVIFNHIAIDPFLSRERLVVTKTSTKRDVSTGDLVPYAITVRNAENVQRAGVTVVDLLPSGFKYVLGSAAVNGIPDEPVATNSNRQLEWRNQTIPANVTVTYNLVLTVGAGVTEGTKVNTGFGLDGPTGAEISNRGSAAVRIVPSGVFDCSELIGKVYEDANRNGYQNEGEPGVPGVRLATVNGLLVTTDEFGRFHIACAAVPDARIGSNFVLKLDPRTLPLGWEPTTDNPRSIRLTRGKMGELNFGVAPQELDDTTKRDAREGGEE